MNFGIISSPVELSIGVLEGVNLSYATDMQYVNTDNHVYFVENSVSPRKVGNYYFTNKLTIVREATDNEKGMLNA